MKQGYYQIFWANYGCNTFEYRSNTEIKTMLKKGIIISYTLIY